MENRIKIKLSFNCCCEEGVCHPQRRAYFKKVLEWSTRRLEGLLKEEFYNMHSHQGLYY